MNKSRATNQQARISNAFENNRRRKQTETALYLTQGPTQHFSDGIGMHFLFTIGESIVKRFFGIYNFSA
jgi:hypothetical protein